MEVITSNNVKYLPEIAENNFTTNSRPVGTAKAIIICFGLVVFDASGYICRIHLW
jgi:hypothetical protein